MSNAMNKIINISDIKMAAYQRVPSVPRVKRIAAEFDAHRMRPVEVSFRDGAYWCFDGQHRIRAYQMLGRTNIPAQVHYGLSYEQEAYLFAEQHRNECAISKKDEWNARLEAGNNGKQTLDIVHILAERGYKIGKEVGASSRVIGAIQEVQHIYARHGAQGLRDVLFVIDTAWNGAPMSTHHDIIAGIGKLLDKYKMTDEQWNRLRDRLAAYTPKEFLRVANTAHGRGGIRVAKSMVELHNKRLGVASSSRLAV